MDFTPKLPDDTVNASDTHPLEEAFTLILGLAAVFILIFLLIGWSVDLAILMISEETEVKVFSKIKEQVQDQTADYDDNIRVERLNEILARLARHWPESRYHFSAGVTPADSPNAFALPGGSILVTSALLESTESENELAFVLGHELGHFKNRDHLRIIGRATLYGLVLSTVFGSSSGNVGDLGSLVGSATSNSFSRSQERAADEFGLRLVYEEYGHVAESWRFFERVKWTDSKETEKLFSYLATHPSSQERIDDLKALAREKGWPLEGPLRPFVESEE